MKKTDDSPSLNPCSDNSDSLSAGELKRMNRELRKKKEYLEDKVLYLEALHKVLTGKGTGDK